MEISLTFLWFESRDILLIEEQMLMVKVTTPKCGELLRNFPFKCEGKCDVCCGEASRTEF
jgi:hypothetical protein